MIVAHDVELRAGARVLMEHATFRVGPGDRVGLVGRNGAGKTTLTKILAGEGQPAAGTITRTGDVGYLPQDPRTGDLEQLARDRVLSARGLDEVIREDAGHRGRDGQRGRRAPGRRDGPVRPARGRVHRARRLRRRERGGDDLRQPRAARAGARPGARHALRRPAPAGRAGPDPVLRRADPAARRADEPPGRRLDRLAAGLPAGLVGRPRRHQPRRRPARRRRQQGVLPRREPVASSTSTTSAGRPTSSSASSDERRRKRERANAEKKASALMAQADKMRAKATKATAAQNMAKRAERLLAGLEGERRADRVAKLRFPEPAPCGRTPLTATRPVEVATAAPRCSPTSTSRSTGAAGSSCSGSTAPARRPCCGCSAGWRPRTPARSQPGPRAAARLLRAGARDAGRRPHRPGEHADAPRPELGDTGVRSVLGLVPVLRGRRRQARRGAVRRREDPAGAGDARRLRRERPAARRADEQPRPGEPRRGARRAAALRRRRRPRDARRGCRRGARSPSGSSCCRTATRTCGTPSTSTSSRWPDRTRPVPAAPGRTPKPLRALRFGVGHRLDGRRHRPTGGSSGGPGRFMVTDRVQSMSQLDTDRPRRGHVEWKSTSRRGTFADVDLRRQTAACRQGSESSHRSGMSCRVADRVTRSTMVG